MTELGQPCLLADIASGGKLRVAGPASGTIAVVRALRGVTRVGGDTGGTARARCRAGLFTGEGLEEVGKGDAFLLGFLQGRAESLVLGGHVDQRKESDEVSDGDGFSVVESGAEGTAESEDQGLVCLHGGTLVRKVDEVEQCSGLGRHTTLQDGLGEVGPDGGGLHVGVQNLFEEEVGDGVNHESGSGRVIKGKIVGIIPVIGLGELGLGADGPETVVLDFLELDRALKGGCAVLLHGVSVGFFLCARLVGELLGGGREHADNVSTGRGEEKS